MRSLVFFSISGKRLGSYVSASIEKGLDIYQTILEKVFSRENCEVFFEF